MLDACPHHHDETDADATPVAPPTYWRSIDEWSNTPEFETMLHREFPIAASEWKDATSRRTFMKLMGASVALGSLSGCWRKPDEKIVPYVEAPEQLVPGVEMYFATVVPFMGYARGALVRSNEGRPTKVEGNPDHPASLGTTDLFAQASILTMYDPDRSQAVVRLGEISAWGSFIAELSKKMDPANAGSLPADGAGIRVLSGTSTSPTLARQKAAFLAKFPAARWHQYDPIGSANCDAGSRMAFGKPANAIYSLEKAKIVVSLDSDFFTTHPASLRMAGKFIDGRRIRNVGNSPTSEMNRLYVIEGTPSVTGAMADHSLRIRPSQIESLARKLADRINSYHAATSQPTSAPINDASTASATAPDSLLDAIAGDLLANRGASLILVGESQPPVVHALAHALNSTLGNVGKTVQYTDPVQAIPGSSESIAALTDDMFSGGVKMLVVLGCNPVYDAPVDLDFERALKQVDLKIRHGLFEDETSFLCDWHLPATHDLEMWSDLRAFDGTASVVQPLIAPLYQGRSCHQVIEYLMGRYDNSDYELVRETWRSTPGAKGGFEIYWRNSLNKGVLDGTAFPIRQFAVNAAAIASAPTTTPSDGGAGSLEAIFRPDPTIWDGCWSNNGWLQECPKPLTKLTWDNAAIISPATADRLELKNDNCVELSVGVGGHTVKGSVLILPGHPDDAVTLHLGYGRSRAGRIGNGMGFNVYAIRDSKTPWQTTDLNVRASGDDAELAVTQHHQTMAGRDLIKVFRVDEYVKQPTSEEEETSRKFPLSLYPPPMNYDDPDHKGNHKWGMSIDNNACIGCNSCIVACNAENNIAVVGKEQIIKGREMHWLRVDAYYTGPLEKPSGPYFEPVPCMHCENAPCELVCPVEATSHSAEGINEMTYNRCVGTRYCSNNCPYKVRHFNFLLYQDRDTESLKLARNPYVTVRTRGVMEKCTYCIQRVNAARITSKKYIANAATPAAALKDTLSDEDRADAQKMYDTMIAQAKTVITSLQTACQQSCPTNAIVFGDLNIKDTQVGRTQERAGRLLIIG